MAMVLSAWAPVEDQETVDKSPYSIEKVTEHGRHSIVRQTSTYEKYEVSYY